MTESLLIMQTVCILLSVAFLYIGFAKNARSYTPPQGERAQMFDHAVTHFPLYRMLHPLLFQSAIILQQRIPARHLARIDKKLKSAGTPLGLNAPEFFAAVLLFGFVCAFVCGMLSLLLLQKGMIGVALGLVFGVTIPFARLDAATAERKQLILHALPGAIDLIALCMRAGQHFQGALSAVSNQMRHGHPLRMEFELMSANIALGASRQEALEKLASRVNVTEMARFVQSVLRAEKKGSSLAEIFSIQAEIMRTQRTQTAEQAASRAAVLMLAPLMLIFFAVFLLLLGPFVVKAYYGTLF